MDYATINEKISLGEYKSKLEYPAKVNKPQMPGFNQTAAVAREYADKLEAWENNAEEIKRLQAAFRADQNHLEQVVFKADLEAAYDLTDHPRKEKVWAKAWEHGHGNGLSEVLYWYDEFAEVL